LAKLAWRDRQNFDCATWLLKATELSKDGFQQAVERELTGKIAEPWEIVYFKMHESQIPDNRSCHRNRNSDAGQ